MEKWEKKEAIFTEPKEKTLFLKKEEGQQYHILGKYTPLRLSVFKKDQYIKGVPEGDCRRWSCVSNLAKIPGLAFSSVSPEWINNECMNEWMHKQIHCINKAWKNGWMNEWKIEWMNGWMNECIRVVPSGYPVSFAGYPDKLLNNNKWCELRMS